MARNIRNSCNYGPDGHLGNTHLYMFVCIENGRYIVKIGVTDFPTKRLDQIRHGCPYEGKTFAVVRVWGRDVAFEIESKLLKAYKKWRLRGEWLSFAPEDKPEFNRIWQELFQSYQRASWPMKWSQTSLKEIVRLKKARVDYHRRQFKIRGEAFRDFSRHIRQA